MMLRLAVRKKLAPFQNRHVNAVAIRGDPKVVLNSNLFAPPSGLVISHIPEAVEA
jgi:hypothetical protein